MTRTFGALGGLAMAGLFSASTSGGGFDPTNPATWIQGGIAVVAIMAVIFLFYKEYVVPGPTHRRLVDELARKDQLLDAKDAIIEGLHDLIEKRELETMSKVSYVLSDVVDLLKERRQVRESRGHDHDLQT